MHFLDRTFLLFVLCLLVNIGVSLSTGLPDAEKVRDYTWSRQMLKEETRELKGMPWYQNYRILSVILIIITILVVGMFA